MIRLGFAFGLASFLASASASAATYYIDYASGLDSNSGIAKSGPWQLAPGMTGFAGNYSHSTGDRFIFKGGVTWPSAALPLVTPGSGEPGNPDYYGVDQSWFTGSAWARPILDDEGTSNADFIRPYPNNYLTIDNIEETGFYWTGTDPQTCVWIGTSIGITIENMYFHNWSHGSYPDTLDTLQVISGVGSDACGSGATPTASGNLVLNSIFDGAPNGTDSAAAVYEFPTVQGCTARNMSNGFMIAGVGGEVSGSIIGPINVSFWPADHENGIEDVCYTGPLLIFDNIIHDVHAGATFLNSASNTYFIFDNIFYNDTPVPIDLDTRFPGPACIYNNTIDASVNDYPCINVDGAWSYLDVRDNYCISDGANFLAGGSNVSTLINNNNVAQTSAQAIAQGYAVANLYLPTLATGATIGAGQDLIANPPTGPCALPAHAAQQIADDISGASRPSSGSWDVGAYEYCDGGCGTLPPSTSSSSGGATTGASTGTSSTSSASSGTTSGTTTATTSTSTGTSTTSSGGSSGMCLTSSTTWQSVPFAAETGSFTVAFDATPNATDADAVTGLSDGPATDFASLAVIVRFNATGTIDARDGETYASVASVPYSAGASYHFELDVDIPTHTYNAFVTAPGSTKQTLGTNFAFRTEQASVAVLEDLSIIYDTASHQVCNFTVGSASASTGTSGGSGSTSSPGSSSSTTSGTASSSSSGASSTGTSTSSSTGGTMGVSTSSGGTETLATQGCSTTASSSPSGFVALWVAASALWRCRRRARRKP